MLDTSILLELLRVPGHAESRQEIDRRYLQLAERGAALLLPVATLIETGNHIADLRDGGLRYQTARRFVVFVDEALRGDSPYQVTEALEWEAAELASWLPRFPDLAKLGDEGKGGLGVADLSIIRAFELAADQNPAAHVFLWSTDSHLQGYDRPAPGWA